MNRVANSNNQRSRLAGYALAAAMVLVLVVAWWLGLGCSEDAGETTSTQTTVAGATEASTTTSTSVTTTTTIYAHPIPKPVRIVIPAIEVDAEIIKVGLDADGNMEVPPFGLAAWYNLGPAPGAHGPSVITAHVDSVEGPDVFFRLKELESGDEILVYGEDGDFATFAVDSQEEVPKEELPVDRIWNDTFEPLIRLITCGGEFDASTRHYVSNVIVYGHLTE